MLLLAILAVFSMFHEDFWVRIVLTYWLAHEYIVTSSRESGIVLYVEHVPLVGGCFRRFFGNSNVFSAKWTHVARLPPLRACAIVYSIPEPCETGRIGYDSKVRLYIYVFLLTNNKG